MWSDIQFKNLVFLWYILSKHIVSGMYFFKLFWHRVNKVLLLLSLVNLDNMISKEFIQKHVYNVTVWTGSLGKVLTNQNVTWEQRIAIFFSNKPIISGLEKYLNSSLLHGQVILKYCLPRALPHLPKFSNSLIIHETRNASYSLACSNVTTCLTCL